MFQSLLCSYPHHDLDVHTKFKTLIRGLDYIKQKDLNMSILGNLTDLTPTQALEACRAYAQKMRTPVLTNLVDIELNVPRIKFNN